MGIKQRELIFYSLQAVLFTLAVVVGCSQEEPKAVPPDALKLEVVPIRSQFVEGEPVIIKAVFRNQAPFTIRINHDFWTWPDYTSLSFEIESPSGKKVDKMRSNVRRPNPNKDDYTAIKGMGTWEYKAELRAFNKPMSEVGSYKISATYLNKDDGKEYGVVNAWTGIVTSSTTTFEIVKRP